MRKSGSVAAVVAATALAVVPHADAEASFLLPDLRQAPVGCAGGHTGRPAACADWDVCLVADASAANGACVATGPARAVRLRFTTAEDNVGDGPLLLYAHRDSTARPTMTVRQAFQSGVDGSIPPGHAQAQRPIPTTAYYEPAATHEHWHLTDFTHFRLRSTDGTTLVTDRKNGFCLGDRYPVADARWLPGKPRGETSPAAVLAQALRGNTCAHHQPAALDVTLGISVGYGDDYRHTVDFQWLDVTEVPSGVYDVVSTVNPDRTLLEKSYDNNTSSLAVDIRWPRGARGPGGEILRPPVVEILRSCPGKPSCAARG
ncbi:lysyl oxidase family protein [Actinokineospora iranica]|nr:lysyl oxidase family protein [Actinokineospora iranica]